MLSDIDKLVKFQELVKELNELKKQLDDEESYENVEVSLSPQVIIKVEWGNDGGSFAKAQQFPFSAIQDVGERVRKKCDYRKAKIEKPEGENDRNHNDTGESNKEADA